jgi:alkylation response protein AidB-like acyl-CoA dehydrogenase
VNFDLSEDQRALREGIRSLLDGAFPMARVRKGFDRAMWDELVDAGVFSLLADGFGWADAAVVFEELGRAAVPGPLVWGLLAYDTDRPPRVVGGVERPAAGVPALVEHLDALDALVILDRDGVHEVDPTTPAATAVEWPLDPLTPVSRVADLPRGERVAGPDVADRRRLEGAVLTAACSVGLAAATCDLAVAYARERRQFDRPIGAFQAVKHLCAEMAVRAEVARVATHAAAVHLDDPGLGGTERAVSGAKLLAGEAAVANGRSATQVHGGMGFTWEVDVHLYLKRAWLLDTTFGTGDEHADRVAASLVPGAPTTG